MNREDLIQQIVEALTRVQRAPKSSIWQTLGLSHAQVGLLFMLYYHQPASVKQLAGSLGVSKSAASQLLEPLTAKGLVSRRTDPDDRRVARLGLSPGGHRLLKKINKLKFAGLRSALATLNDKDLKLMAELHKKLAAGPSRTESGSK